jgi:hypothetical protein
MSDRSDASRDGGGQGKARLWGIRLAFLLVSTLIAFELVAQAYIWKVHGDLEAMRKRSDHYMQASDDPRLVYELKRNQTIERNERRLRINRYGIRDDEDVVPEQWRIALLGASVVFGDRHHMRNTIGAFLQEDLDPAARDVRVLNFAVPGYGNDEHLENLKVKDAIYDVDYVVFILNAVDFAERDTRFEGGDNGLYRMYKPPRWAGLYLLRKAIYRYHKGGPPWAPNLVSIDWYRWLYNGTREHGFEVIKAMDEYCESHGCGFTLALLPPGSAYVDGHYALEDMYREIYDFAQRNGIDAIQSIDTFADGSLFDKTDHLTAEGNRILAELLARHLEPAVHAAVGDRAPAEDTARVAS